ncbi:MAG: DUF4345 domain-containing protein [Deltaproteobacteria bacterium]|nr:DUF4345 domain-containing protein [Deltaproteobacteria bacterium]
MEIFNLIVLGLSGLLLTFAGSNRLFRPIKSLCLTGFAEKHGSAPEKDADLYSEMRGAGTLTLFSGIAILAGTVIPEFRLTSFVVGIVIFLGYAIGRSFSIGTDGKPSKDTLGGLYSEVLFAALHIICLVMLLI